MITQQGVGSCHSLIVSDNRLLADAIGSALCDAAELASYECARYNELHTHLRRTQLEPQIVILDACCVCESDRLFSTTSRLAQELPETQIVVLAYHADKKCVIGCVESGAKGFILKTESLPDVVATVHALKNGHSRCCREVTDVILEKVREYSSTKAEAAKRPDAELTEREVEVLQLVAEQLVNKQIARRLGLQLSTVKNHLSSAFEKLDVSNRRQAVSQALALGILDSHPEPAVD